MKKLLSLVLVLALASLANAMILQISVNGNPEPIDSTITLLPSEEVVLDILSPDGYTTGSDVYWALVVNPAVGTISGGHVIMPPAPDGSSMLPADWGPYFSETELGVYGCVISYSAPTAPAGVYFDGIIFHCEGPGDAVIQLISTVDFGSFTVEDTVIIHQEIPEPATIALLSLGGLLLRRKK
jgi:hypothetical protein